MNSQLDVSLLTNGRAFLRRVALRALSTRIASTSLLSAPKQTFVTCSSAAFKPQVQWTLSRFQRRFASEDSSAARPDEEIAERESSLAEETSAIPEGAEASESAINEPVLDEQQAETIAAASEVEGLCHVPSSQFQCYRS
jgi:hypothetical protein